MVAFALNMMRPLGMVESVFPEPKNIQIIVNKNIMQSFKTPWGYIFFSDGWIKSWSVTSRSMNFYLWLGIIFPNPYFRARI